MDLTLKLSPGSGKTLCKFTNGQSSRLMRLLHLMDYEPRGTRAIDQLILGLATQGRVRGWDVRFGFLSPPPPEFAEKLLAVDAKWHLIQHPLTFASLRELKRQLGDYRPDVLQTSFLSVFQLPLLWLKLTGFTKRLIVLDHSSGVGPTTGGLSRLARRIRGKLVGSLVDAVATVSRYNAQRDIDRVFLPKHKVMTIYNGIIPSLFPYTPRRIRDTVRLGFIGQLIQEKGVQTLLKALRILQDSQVTNWTLQIAGRGHQEPQLQGLVQELGLKNVIFRGHVDDMSALLSELDVVIIPSEWAEAFGYVAIEAMASGAAVITSDVGGLPEVVGDVGIVFPTGDATTLAKHIQFLMDHPEERHNRGVAGCKRVGQQFHLDTKVTRHLDLCEAVLKADLVKEMSETDIILE